MDQAEAEALCISLINENSEAGVISLLTEAGYWNDKSCWRYYGDKPANWAQGGGQQSRADFALNEKVVNSIDSVLMRRCIEQGIHPESDAAPKSIRVAVAKFIENSDTSTLKTTSGRVEDWPPDFATQVAQNISVFSTEDQNAQKGTVPCINIADCGEGHTPNQFPHTFVSLKESNKLGIPFTQGRFGQGGTGVFRFGGPNRLQLVVSRRHPALIGSEACPEYPCHEDDDAWGFTIVRRVDGASIPVLQYLAPIKSTSNSNAGEVLRFRRPKLPLFPEKDVAYNREVESGTLIKLYEYQIKTIVNAPILRRAGLLRKLDILLPDPALPIRLHECRPRVREGDASEQTTTMAGILSRSRSKRTTNFEQVDPPGIIVNLEGKKLTGRVITFARDKGKNYLTNEGIIYTVYGQAHGYTKSSFFTRRTVGLKRIAKDLLVVLDCSPLSSIEREDLFMSSKDRLAEDVPLATELEKALAIALKEHPGLRKLKKQRADEELNEKLSDDKPLEDILNNFASKAPAFLNLFSKGNKGLLRKRPNKGSEKTPEKPILRKHPSYFRPTGRNENEIYERAAHIEQRCRLTFITDAENDYFTRKYDPGSFEITSIDGSESPIKNYVGPNLIDGTCSVSFELPPILQVGDVLELQVVVADPVTKDQFVCPVRLNIDKKTEKAKRNKQTKKNRKSTDTGTNDSNAGFSIPRVVWLNRNDTGWKTHFKSDYDCINVIDDTDEDNESENSSLNESKQRNLTIYLNEDNLSFLEQLSARKNDAKLFKRKYEFACVLMALAVYHDFDTHKDQSEENQSSPDQDEEEEIISKRVIDLGRAMAPFLVPMIEELSVYGESDEVDEVFAEAV